MFVKLVVLACVAVASAQHWNGGWNGNNAGWNGGNDDGSWRGDSPAISGAYTGDGDYHGEGLQEAGTYNDVSQNWNDNNGQWNGGNNGQWNGGHNGQWNGGNNGQWNGGNNGQWNGGHNGQWNGGNNGQWNGGNNGAWNGAGHNGQALLPAGVDAHACPNYPFCH